MIWKIYKNELPPMGEEVLAFNKEWINEDYNPNGTRIGFQTDEGFISAYWWSYQDCYMTIPHSECDDNDSYSDEIRDHIEPEKWISLKNLIDLL